MEHRLSHANDLSRKKKKLTLENDIVSLIVFCTFLVLFLYFIFLKRPECIFALKCRTFHTSTKANSAPLEDVWFASFEHEEVEMQLTSSSRNRSEIFFESLNIVSTELVSSVAIFVSRLWLNCSTARERGSWNVKNCIEQTFWLTKCTSAKSRKTCTHNESMSLGLMGIGLKQATVRNLRHDFTLVLWKRAWFHETKTHLWHHENNKLRKRLRRRWCWVKRWCNSNVSGRAEMGNMTVVAQEPQLSNVLSRLILWLSQLQTDPELSA